ncbi:MAG: carbohydrate ABC transporter permease [Acetobacteraceae bacterium]
MRASAAQWWWRRRRARQAAIATCFLAPSLAIFFLYRILPLFWNVVLSFERWSPLRPARWEGLHFYQEMLASGTFWTALVNTLIFIGSAAIAIAIALVIALLVNSDLKGAAVYRTIVFLSYPLMTVAVAIIWQWMFEEKAGLINYVLLSLGVISKPIPFLSSFVWALPSVIVANIWQVLGFYMIVLLAGLQNIPPHLYEAARIDGVPAFARFRRVTLPLLRPALFLAAVIGILNSFSCFDLVYVMTHGGPDHATEILITYIYKAAFEQSRFDYAAALTVVQFVLLLVLTALANRAAGGNAGALE